MKAPDTFPSLDVTFNANGLVLLEQDDGCGSVEHVALHPAHVQHIAEKLGLIEKGMTGARAQATTLRRRLETLRYRLDRLTDMLNLCGEHENLQPEQDYAMASWEIANEFCEDFDEAFPQAIPKGFPQALGEDAVTRPAAAPATPGTFQVVRATSKPARPETQQLDLEGLPLPSSSTKGKT